MRLVGWSAVGRKRTKGYNSGHTRLSKSYLIWYRVPGTILVASNDVGTQHIGVLSIIDGCAQICRLCTMVMGLLAAFFHYGVSSWSR